MLFHPAVLMALFLSLPFASFTMVWWVAYLSCLEFGIFHLFQKILRHYVFKYCFRPHSLSNALLDIQLHFCHHSCVSCTIFYISILFFFVFWAILGLNIFYWALTVLILFLPVFNLLLNPSVDFLILIIVSFTSRISTWFSFNGFHFFLVKLSCYLFLKYIYPHLITLISELSVTLFLLSFFFFFLISWYVG